MDNILRLWLNMHLDTLFYNVGRYSNNHLLIIDRHHTINKHVMADMWDDFEYTKPIFKYLDQEKSNSSLYLLNKYGDELLEIIEKALTDYVERYKQNDIDYLVWKRRKFC